MNADLGTVITLILGLITAFFGTYWAVAKGKIKKIVIAGKEFVDVGRALDDALSDDKITKDELEKIKSEWREAKAAFKAIIQKE